MDNENQNQSDTISVPLYRHPNLQIIFGVTLMAVMGVVTLTPAFPKIADSLHISTQKIGLLITVFTLPGIILTPLLGIMADRYGRKIILTPSLFLFAIAGVSCAFTSDFHTLLILRFFQGVGAASLSALNTTIIGDLYSGHQLNEAMGYNSAALNIGTSLYPAIGGLLATFGWHYPFLISIAAVPIGFLVLFSLKSPEPQSRQNLKKYLNNIWVSFQDRQVIGLFIASFIIFIILYGSYLTYLPFFMKGAFGSSVLIIGLVSSMTSVGSGVMSTQLGRLLKKYTKKSLLMWGCFFYIISMVLIPYSPNIWILAAVCILFGVANGLNIPAIQSLLASLAPIEYRGAFMSANGMVLRVGQTLGPILMGTIFFALGISWAFFAGALCALCMLILLYFTMK